MPKLYEITANYEKIMEAIDNNDGVVSDHLGATLDETQDEFDTKIINIAKMIKNMEGEQTAFEAEGQRLKDKAWAVGNNINWLKNYIKDGMKRMKTNEVKGKILTIKIRPSEPWCRMITPRLVPPGFFRNIPATQELDKKAVIKHYKEQKKTVPGTEIGFGTTLTIR